MAELEKVIEHLNEIAEYFRGCRNNASFASKAENHFWELQNAAGEAAELLKAQEPDKSKYEYHTDHTDCPWYISGEESKCPVTCSQYRDGWNDAMNYIFRNGDGYRPYDRTRKGR